MSLETNYASLFWTLLRLSICATRSEQPLPNPIAAGGECGEPLMPQLLSSSSSPRIGIQGGGGALLLLGHRCSIISLHLCYFLHLLSFLSLPFFSPFVLLLLWRGRERDGTGGWIPNLRESESQSPLHLPALHLFQLILKNSKVNTFGWILNCFTIREIGL